MSKIIINNEKHLTAQEVAKKLGISKSTLRGRVANGLIRTSKIKGPFFSESEVKRHTGEYKPKIGAPIGNKNALTKKKKIE